MRSLYDAFPVIYDKSAIPPTNAPMPPKPPVPCCYMDAEESTAARGFAGLTDVKKLKDFSYVVWPPNIDGIF